MTQKHTKTINPWTHKHDQFCLENKITPDCPEGLENNWIQTVPGKGWFAILRLYGPGEEWFDQTWRPGEIELVAEPGATLVVVHS